MNKVLVTLKDGSINEYEPGTLVPVGLPGRGLSILILICGALLILLSGIDMLVTSMQSNRTGHLILGVVLLAFGVIDLKNSPKKSSNTIKSGFIRNKTFVLAQDLAKVDITIARIYLLNPQGNKVAVIKKIEEK